MKERMALLLHFPHSLSLSDRLTRSFDLLLIPKPKFLSFSNSESASLNHHCLPLRSKLIHKKIKAQSGTFCYYTSIKPETLQWVCAVSSVVLMLTKGAAVQKSFLVPLFALQAPTTLVSWMKGEYGGWSAFLALLVRLFYHIPGELELPFLTLLLVIVAPYQAMNLRGTQAGAVISLAISGFLALQHFSRLGSLQRAFDQGSIIATLAIICITIVPCLFLF